MEEEKTIFNRSYDNPLVDELLDEAKDDPNEMGGPFVSLSWVASILEGK